MGRPRKLTIDLNKASSKSLSMVCKEIRKLVINPATIADAVYLTAETIGRSAETGYRKAQYSGSKRVRYNYTNYNTNDNVIGIEVVEIEDKNKKQISLFNRRGFITTINGVEYKYVYKEFVGKADVPYSMSYKVKVSGQLAPILEFGSGQRFTPTRYGSKWGATRGGYAKTLAGKQGLWVYKGVAGSFPYRDGQPLDRNGVPREGYYYSAGNAPSYVLFNAVQDVRNNFKAIYKKAHWSHWL